jgi:vacuolar-type H+-ATPase subunit H
VNLLIDKGVTDRMEKPTPANGLSPLDQIRLVEGEMTRRLIVAREAAEQQAVKARAEAATLKGEAKEKGEVEGQIRYKEVTKRAEEEAKVLRAQAEGRAESLRRDGAVRMDRAVDRALQIILGMREEGGQ